jgi:hypothetical protein
MMQNGSHDREDTLPTERIGMIVYILMANRGKKYTTAELAGIVGLQHHSMWYMMCKLSRKVPIVQEIDGWSIP